MQGLFTGSVLLRVSRPCCLECFGVDSKDVAIASRKLLERIYWNQLSQQGDFIGSQTLGLRDNRNQEHKSHTTVSLLAGPLSSLCWLYLFLFFCSPEDWFPPGIGTMAISSSCLIRCLPLVLIGQTSEETFYCPALGCTQVAGARVL